MLIRLLIELVNIYSMCIVVYCIFSWFPIGREGVLADIANFFRMICEPYLNLFKKLIPPIGGMVDITPIIAMLVLQLGVTIIARLL